MLKRCFTAKACESLKRLDEHFLNDVFDFVFTPRISPGGSENPRLIFQHQRLETRLVAGEVDDKLDGSVRAAGRVSGDLRFMTDIKLIAITGPAAVGKSTVARALQLEFVRSGDLWLVIDLDSFARGLPQGVGLGTIDGADIGGGGDGVRPMLIGDAAKGGGSFDRWFNVDAFGRPPQGYYGDAPIAPIYGPGQANFDITLMKKFPLWSDKRSLEFRSEFYNAFNHTQFNAVDSFALFDSEGKQQNGQFGQIVATRAPRVIQFSLRIEF